MSKVLVVGAGSIGRRRGEILANLGHEVFYVDPARKDADYYDLGDAVDMVVPEVVLICTPPDSDRAAQINLALDVHPRGLFVEKPLALTFADLHRMQKVLGEDFDRRRRRNLPDLVGMGACNMRFADGVRELRQALREYDGYAEAELVMGQSARLWNPAHKPVSMLLDSIHELDLAYYLMGDIESIRGWSTDLAATVGVHHMGQRQSRIAVNRVSEPPTRWIRVFSPDGPSELLELNNPGPMYVREMAYFMDMVLNYDGLQPENHLDIAMDTTRVALEICDR